MIMSIVSVITRQLHRISLIIGDLPCTILGTISNVSVSYFITYLLYFIPKLTYIPMYIYSYCISVQRNIQIIHTQFSATFLCYYSLVSVIMVSEPRLQIQNFSYASMVLCLCNKSVPASLWHSYKHLSDSIIGVYNCRVPYSLSSSWKNLIFHNPLQLFCLVQTIIFGFKE